MQVRSAKLAVSYDKKGTRPNAARGGERIRHARLDSAIRRQQGVGSDYRADSFPRLPPPFRG